MFRLYTKEKQFIHHLNKEKALANVTLSIYSHVKDIFYSVKTEFFSEREILVIH